MGSKHTLLVGSSSICCTIGRWACCMQVMSRADHCHALSEVSCMEDSATTLPCLAVPDPQLHLHAATCLQASPHPRPVCMHLLVAWSRMLQALRQVPPRRDLWWGDVGGVCGGSGGRRAMLGRSVQSVRGRGGEGWRAHVAARGHCRVAARPHKVVSKRVCGLRG